MTTIVCDIDGCDYSLDAAGRGYMRMGVHRRAVHGLAAGTAPKPRKVDGDDDGPAPIHHVDAEATPAAPAETPPKRSRWKWFGRKGTDAPAPQTKERAPKRRFSGKRVPLDTDISDAWAFLGRRLEATPHYPTGRMLQYQAPGAGVIVDKAVAGTFLDNALLQPIARSRDKYEDVAFLVAGPLVTFAMTRTLQEMEVASHDGDAEAFEALQRRFEMQQEGFDWLLAAMLPRLAEGKRIAEEKKKKEDAIVADAFPELAGTGISPAEALRDMLFSPPKFGGAHERTGAAAQNGDRPDTVAERRDAASGARSPAEG